MYEVTAARGELKKMQKRRKPPRRRTGVRQRRFSAVEKAKTLFRLLKESARIPTSFRKSDYTKAIIKCLVFAFSVCAFLAEPPRGEIKKMQKRRNTTRRRTSVRQRRVSAVEKADNYSLWRNPIGFYQPFRCREEEFGSRRLSFQQPLRHGKPCHLPLHRGGKHVRSFSHTICLISS